MVRLKDYPHLAKVTKFQLIKLSFCVILPRNHQCFPYKKSGCVPSVQFPLQLVFSQSYSAVACGVSCSHLPSCIRYASMSFQDPASSPLQQSLGHLSPQLSHLCPVEASCSSRATLQELDAVEGGPSGPRSSW